MLVDSSEGQLMFDVGRKVEFFVNGNLLALGTNEDGVNDFALMVQPFALN